jgi:hypothetical protein
MAKQRSPKNERRAEEVMRTMRALASLTEDDWQELTDEERAEVKAMLADKAWLTRDAFFWSLRLDADNARASPRRDS